MANLFRRTLLFAAGALAATAAVVRVRSNVAPRPAPADDNIYFAILAEGDQWEVRVEGGGLDGTWHVDVPGSCRDLPPAGRMLVVDKIMRRIAKHDAPKPPSPRDRPRFVSRRPELRIAYDHA